MRRLWTTISHNFTANVLRDWRGQVLICSAAIAVFGTLALAFVPGATDVGHFWGATFASWVAGVVLFVLTGLIIGLISIARPELDLLDSRIRNLLQRQEGPHIDYVHRKIRSQFEPYLAHCDRHLHVVAFDRLTRTFQIAQQTELVYRSFLTDVDLPFQSRIGYAKAAPPPPGANRSCLNYLKVAGQDVGGQEEFDSEVIRPFDIKIAAHSDCRVEHHMVYWVLEGDPNRQRTIRFMRVVRVHLHNQLARDRLKVSCPGNPGADRIIRPGEEAQVINIFDISPPENEDEVAFDFRITLVEEAQQKV
jgi:hypothetical protein